MGAARTRWKGWIAGWSLLGFGLIALVVATPFLLRHATPSRSDWTELASISQAYAAISIPFSGVALIGVVASLAYQARQVHNDREDAQLAAHRELTMRLLEDPDLLVCWGPPPRPISAIRAKQHAYVNLIVSFWHADFIVGRLTDAVLQGAATHLFQGEIGREFWEMQGENWKNTAATRGRRSSRFVELVQEGFVQAQAAGPPIPASLFYVSGST
ncbi:hypothetical protein GCM10011579_068040 [Streptomyces albiflavescens]|uniref:Uncharacterized protein n=1 Tax=Streptomyces albiflavescens TaxID=1623582 RepID=A0A917YC20_9ACTN|nr:DUF6082 family protein [Streptomyces albiflavescens]GGN81450.1 hypothetical protein GCM10011579_068040 [Streptomyces albiflavescens]